MWVKSLEAEENDRLESLNASISAFEAAKTPTTDQVNALLISAFLGQLTLMRVSRVFPDRCSGKGTNVSLGLSHAPTALLSRRLHHCWKALGVTHFTLRALLQQAVFTAGAQTRNSRTGLFMNLIPYLRRGVDPKAQVAFAAEGSGQPEFVFPGL